MAALSTIVRRVRFLRMMLGTSPALPLLPVLAGVNASGNLALLIFLAGMSLVLMIGDVMIVVSREERVTCRSAMEMITAATRRKNDAPDDASEMTPRLEQVEADIEELRRAQEVFFPKSPSGRLH